MSERRNFDRRTSDTFGIYTRTQIAEILEKAKAGQGSGNPNGYVRNPEYAIRDAALEAAEYLLGKRVSEYTGRKYYEDTYSGLTVQWNPDGTFAKESHVRIGKDGPDDVLQFYVRILKRAKRKKKCLDCQKLCDCQAKFCPQCGADILKIPKTAAHMKQVWKWKNISLSDPFTKYILDWLNYMKAHDLQGRVFPISRVAAWTIMKNLGIDNHINRHWRATHLSDTMKPHELKEELDRATLPVEYMHASPKKRREAIAEANKEWQ
jgi:hypothetical protein